MVGRRCSNCGALVAANRTLCPSCTSLGVDQSGTGSATRASAGIQSRLALTARPVAIVGWASVAVDRPLPAAETSSPAAIPSTASQRRHWYRRARFIVPITIVALIAVVAAFYVIRFRQAFATINSVSTPVAVISGAALGGSANITIDTGPAQTAIAGGVSSAKTNSDDTAPIPSHTDTGGAVSQDRKVQSAAIDPSDSGSEGGDSPDRAGVADRPTETAVRGAQIEPTATATPSTTALAEPTVRATNTAQPKKAVTALDPTRTVAPEPTSTALPETAVPSTTLTEAPEPSPTASPTTEPTATATTVPTPILSEIERIKNGDFEQGTTSWYLEQGAAVTTGDAHGGQAAFTIDTTGGFASQRFFFVPETTYQLTFWAKLSAKGAESATVGIGYEDENETRLTDLEPAVTTIERTKWTEFTVSFTTPAAASDVLIYFWKPSGKAILSVDDVSIRSVVPPDTLDVETQEPDAGSMTILLMGVDARPGEAIDTGVRPDSLMVVHLNATTGSCRLLSIPRDTRTELPGYGMTKVNHALAVGGIDYQKQVVELMTGLKIDHYLLIDFNGFEDLVDAVGGISVDVPEDFTSSDGTQFSAGRQEMTGKQALSYARWRGGPDGDFGRMQRQQQILRALVQKASGLNVITSINDLLPAVEQNIRTDFSATDMARVATEFRSRCTESTISMTRLEGTAATYDDPLLQMPLYYIEVDQAEIRRKVAALVEP